MATVVLVLAYVAMVKAVFAWLTGFLWGAERSTKVAIVIMEEGDDDNSASLPSLVAIQVTECGLVLYIASIAEQ